MRRHVISASLLLLGAGLLAGCGQKGPLFLPPTKPVAPQPAASTPPPAPAVAAPATSTAPSVLSTPAPAGVTFPSPARSG
ncbi:MAG: LPS translocon maturation chaperone LptM [Rhodanobacteraceae bacterium]